MSELDYIKREASEIIELLWKNAQSAPFRYPVPYEEWGLEDYPKIIKKPMDLNTLKKGLNKGVYINWKNFTDDLRLIWKNCMTYNREGSCIYNQAELLGKLTESILEKKEKEMNEGNDTFFKNKMILARSIKLFNEEKLKQVIEIVRKHSENALEKISDQKLWIYVDRLNEKTVDILINETIE